MCDVFAFTGISLAVAVGVFAFLGGHLDTEIIRIPDQGGLRGFRRNDRGSALVGIADDGLPAATTFAFWA